MKNVFISYNSLDHKFVTRLARDLRAHGLAVWLDIWRITGREPFWSEIETGILEADALIFIISPNSMNKSSGVWMEISHAIHHNKQLVLVMAQAVDYNSLPIEITPGRHQIHDLTGRRYKRGLGVVLQALGGEESVSYETSAVENQKKINENQKKNKMISGAKAFLSSSVWQGIAGIAAILAVVWGFYTYAIPNSGDQKESASTLTATDDNSILSIDENTPIANPNPPATTAPIIPTGNDNLQLQSGTTAQAQQGGEIEIDIILFRDANSLTVYILGDQLVDITGFNFQVTDLTGRTDSYVLERYPAFVGLPFDKLPTPICFRLQTQGANSPFPLECQSLSANRLFVQYLSDANLFWHNKTTNQDFSITITRGSTEMSLCPANQARCIITYSQTIAEATSDQSSPAPSNTDGLSEYFTYEGDNITLTLNYPNGWVIRDELGGIEVANSQATLDRVDNTFELESDDIWLYISLPIERSLISSADELAELFTAELFGVENENIEIGEIVEDELDGKAVIRMAISRDDKLLGEVIIMEANGGFGAIVIATIGDYNNARLTIEAIIHSIILSDSSE